jgi:DNA-binding NarL/FixJ family response regulator
LIFYKPQEENASPRKTLTNPPPKKPIRIAVLDDHQGIIDGYRFRLENDRNLEIVAEASFGDDLEAMLLNHVIDLLILDEYVPTSDTNLNPYPILHMIPRLLDRYTNLVIIVISVVARTALIKAVMDAGASGYILKDDLRSLKYLGSIIHMIMDDGIYMSRDAERLYTSRFGTDEGLSGRQLEALSLCAAYPNQTTVQLASTMGIARSTIRNLLSQAYIKVQVGNRSGAILKAQRLGLISPPDAESPG